MELRTITFSVPSGHEFTIREQNGEDEDILSNPKEMRNLLHLSRFISAITVNTNFTSSGKLNFNEALNIPLLDRYCILLKSRIFSLGNTLEFSFEWNNEITNKKETLYYEEDLNSYLFEDYSNIPSDEEVLNKPNAVPMYPDTSLINGKEFTLSSGKKVWWQLATSSSEQYIYSLSEDKRTYNAELIARNLKLEVDGKFERVYNFSSFSAKDMAEIRKMVKTYDPSFLGLTDITNPNTGETTQYPIIAAPGFFFLIEA